MTTDAEHLAQMHPWLRAQVEAAVADWRASAAEGDTIRIVESVRSTSTQARYFAEGRSKADGVNRLSLHQFAPALAADVAIIRAGKVVAKPGTAAASTSSSMLMPILIGAGVITVVTVVIFAIKKGKK